MLVLVLLLATWLPLATVEVPLLEALPMPLLASSVLVFVVVEEFGLLLATWFPLLEESVLPLPIELPLAVLLVAVLPPEALPRPVLVSEESANAAPEREIPSASADADANNVKRVMRVLHLKG